jgi:GT2 family glycosyltransferase
MLELLKNIASLDKAADLLEEIIIVNNASTSDYSAVTQYIQTQQQLPIKYIYSEANLGVAKGRNFAIKQSAAPILIMLDDDAVLQNKDCLVQLVNEFDQPDTSRPKAIISFKVLYYDTLTMQKNALPHKRFEEYKDKSFFETYYYAGGAHAIKRQALDKVGLYPEDFFYGMEEYDMSYRLLDAGYSIVYSDKVVMLHKESPLGRKPKSDKLRMMWVNKSKVAWRYLPKQYFYSTTIMWSLFYLKETGFHLKGLIKGFQEVQRIKHLDKRKPISPTTLSFIKSLKARLYY